MPRSPLAVDHRPAFDAFVSALSMAGTTGTVIDAESGMILWASPRFGSCLSVSGVDLGGVEISGIIELDAEPGKVESVLERLQDAAKSGRVLQGQAPRTSDCERLPHEIRVSALDLDGVACLSVVFREIGTRHGETDGLRDQAKFLAQTEKLASLGGWEVDLRSMKAAWTAEAYNIHELSVDQEIDLEEAIKFYPPEARPIVEGAVRRTIEDGTPFDFVQPLITSKGRRILVRGIGEAVRVNGEIVAMRGIVQDVTKQYEQDLAHDRAQEQAKLYSTLFQISNSLPAVADHNWHFKLLSQSWTAVLGWTQEELTSRPFYEFLHPDDREATNKLYEKLRDEKGVATNFDNRYACKGGGYRWLSWNVVARDDAMYCVATDITERRELVRQLEESEARFRALADTIPVMVWATRADGSLEFLNQRARELTGLSEEHCKTLEGRASVVHPEDAKGLLQLRARSWKTGSPYQSEVRIFSAIEQRYVWVLCRCVPERDRAGNIIRWLGVSTEIDHQKREQERERLVLNELDHRVNNNLTTVLTIAHHTARRSTSLEEFLPKFEGRVRSLSLAHKALSANRWHGVRFREFIEQILQGIIDPSVNAITLEGDDILLPTYVAPPLSLIVNELAVNALKHGAFSEHASGPVGIRWELSEEQFRFSWIESTSLKIDPGTFTGFGTRLIRGLTSHQLGGSAEFRTDCGLECHIAVPLRLAVDQFALDRPDQG